MCVSAESSFTLAGLLTLVGAYCLGIAAQRDRWLLPLAAVPLLFGVQQACEGLVWVGIGRADGELLRSASLVYLFFALTFWLFWIPLSAAFLESRTCGRLLLAIGAVLGLAGGLAFYLPILLHPEVLLVTVVRHSLRYDFTQSAAAALDRIPPLAWHLAYLTVVSLPLLFVSRTRRGLMLFSASLILSAAISHAYFWYAFASVWCFFAAILSILLGRLFHGLPAAAKARLADVRC